MTMRYEKIGDLTLSAGQAWIDAVRNPEARLTPSEIVADRATALQGILDVILRRQH